MHEGHRERMRARYMREGADGFAPHEIFEMLLYYTYSRKNTNPIAHALLDKFNPAEVFDADKKELVKVEGIGSGSAEFLNFISECIDAYKKAKQKTGIRITSSAAAGEYLSEYIKDWEQEAFYVLCMNINRRVTAVQKIASHAVSDNVISNREVVECVLKGSAHSVILAHNHKAGALFVSQEDIDLNNRLCDALDAIDVTVIDHIVLNRDAFISMAEQGFFKRR